MQLDHRYAARQDVALQMLALTPSPVQKRACLLQTLCAMLCGLFMSLGKGREQSARSSSQKLCPRLQSTSNWLQASTRRLPWQSAPLPGTRGTQPQRCSAASQRRHTMLAAPALLVGAVRKPNSPCCDCTHRRVSQVAFDSQAQHRANMQGCTSASSVNKSSGTRKAPCKATPATLMPRARNSTVPTLQQAVHVSTPAAGGSAKT